MLLQIFLGGKKPPEFMDWDKFMARVGGSHNAHTTADLTTFFVSVPHSALDETARRFLDLILRPTFTEDSLVKEVGLPSSVL